MYDQHVRDWVLAIPQAQRIARYAQVARDRQILRNKAAQKRYTERRGKSHPLYPTWRGMIQRCHNPSNSQFKDYGARGITVCDSWMSSYEQFCADMGSKPSKEHSIERLNNDLGYSPDNCKWATRLEHSLNKRSTDRATYKYLGLRLTIFEWSKILEASAGALRIRFKRRGTFERVKPVSWAEEVDSLLSKK